MSAPLAELQRVLAEAPRTLPLTQKELQIPSESCSRMLARGTELLAGIRNEKAAYAGLLLRFGCWEESHNLAQDISSTEGSYWHAILHRLEPDADNAAYWFRRVGKHAIFPELYERVTNILTADGPEHWTLKDSWDPLLFVEWCEEAQRRKGRPEETARQIQMAEWELLFTWCAADRSGDNG